MISPNHPHAEPMRFWQSLWPSLEAMPVTGRHSVEAMELLAEYVAHMLNGGSLVCIDENDVRDVLAKPGCASLGVGEAAGKARVEEATERAIADFLADQARPPGEVGALVMVAGSGRIRLQELIAVLHVVHRHFGNDDILLGHAFDDDLGETLRVYLIGVIGE